jgi:cytochrome P450
MQAHFFPFGTGSRQCGGQNMAQAVIRMVVAAIVRNFDIVSPPETNEDSMQMCDSFVRVPMCLRSVCLTRREQVIFPKAMKCKLIFIPREH